MRIEPSDGAVATPINDIHPTAPRVLEHNDGAPVRSSSATADATERDFSASVSFGHDDRIETLVRFFLLLEAGLHHIVRDFAFATAGEDSPHGP